MGCQKTHPNINTKLRYTKEMNRFISQNNFARLFVASVLIFTQSCDLLQKRDISPNNAVDKSTRNFKLLTYAMNEQFALSDSADPQRYIRNALSSLASASLVATRESSFQTWVKPTARCLPSNSNDLFVQRVRLNLDMGIMTLKSESTLQQVTINQQNTTVGPSYGALGWLPVGLYTFSATGASPVLAWSQSSVPVLGTGKNIGFWSNGAWIPSVSPDLDLSEHFVIKTSEDFKIRYQAPAQTSYVLVQLTDGIGNRVSCYTNPDDGGITIPQTSLVDLNVGPAASIEIKFINTRLDTSHPRIDEIFTQSTTRHVFGRIHQNRDQYLDFGSVEVRP